MKLWNKAVILVSVFFVTMNEAKLLKCWKCIAHDCDTDPEDNYKASKVKCQEGQKCMKVRYRMFDNRTHYDSVIRTCTDKTCETSSQEGFYSCIATPKQYMISGCTLRSCCDDRDLCNSADSIHLSTKLQIFATLLYLFWQYSRRYQRIYILYTDLEQIHGMRA